MRLRFQDIEEATKELAYEEPTEPLNALVMRGSDQEFRFQSPAQVNLRYYRAGLEVFLDGWVESVVSAECARCLDEFDFSMKTHFSYVLAPRQPSESMEGDEEQIDFDFYDGQHVEVSPLVYERILLTLPTRPLCVENCRGLCPKCGINLNRETCTCETQAGDPRLAVFRSLKLH